MGLDYYPCRVEPNVDLEMLSARVQREFEYFVRHSPYLDDVLLPLVGMDPFASYGEFIESEWHHWPSRREARCRLAREYPEKDFFLPDLLLMKFESHRVYAVNSPIFPLDWRLNAYRTILPDELPVVFRRWVDHRAAVRRGAFRGYLEEVLYFESAIKLGTESLHAVSIAHNSLQTTGSWAQHPELVAVRDRILQLPPPESPSPPTIAVDAQRTATLDDRWAALRAARDQLLELTRAWNDAARRGNWSLNEISELPAVEDWIQQILREDWFDDFAEWLKPWLAGGYGLYRDNEERPSSNQ